MTVQADGPAVLHSNSVPIPFDDDTFAPLPDSGALLGDSQALRERVRHDGALHLRGVVDRDWVLRLRAEYFGMFPAGYLRPGTAPVDGILGADVPQLPPYGVAGHPAHAFVRGESMRQFVDQPALRQLAEALLGTGSVVRLPRVILRHFDNRAGKSSRAHVDHTYMNRGGADVITMWLPVGDSPLLTGGLVYLQGSHRIPREDLDALRAVTDRPGDDRPLSHDLGWVARRLGRRGLWADYRAGDVAVHGPHVVHGGLDNTTDVMRMSVDVRYAVDGSRLDERWLRPWSADDGA